jgi:uncharacterized integral membrane protein
MAQIVPHKKPVEFIYRSGFTLQTLGFLALALSTDAAKLDPVASIAGYVLIDIGVLLSGWLLQVYMREVRLIILISALVGVATQMLGVAIRIGYLIPFGLGVTFIGSAGLGGKEAYCFQLNEGWYLMPALGLLALSLIVQQTVGHPLFISKVMLIIVLAIQSSFTIRKYRMPYLAECASDS